jgi:hypothetical protein
MARKRGFFRRILGVCVLALAVFGGYTLYKNHQSDVDDASHKVVKKAKKVGKALTE